jgi:hypothetical protein
MVSMRALESVKIEHGRLYLAALRELFPNRIVCSSQPYVSYKQRCLCLGSTQVRLTFGSGLFKSAPPLLHDAAQPRITLLEITNF